MFLIYAILFLFFIYCKIFINYKMRVSKCLRLNTLRLMPCLTNTRTPPLTLSPFKTLVLTICLGSTITLWSSRGHIKHPNYNLKISDSKLRFGNQISNKWQSKDPMDLRGAKSIIDESILATFSKTVFNCFRKQNLV